MPAPKDMVKGNAVVLILSCLSREPMHGYRIAKEISQQSEGFFVLGEGTLYPQLHQLEEDGLIEGFWDTGSGGRERKLYRITENGTAELAKRREQWRKYQASLNRILDVAPNGA